MSNLIDELISEAHNAIEVRALRIKEIEDARKDDEEDLKALWEDIREYENVIGILTKGRKDV